MQEVFRPSCWSPGSVSRLANLLIVWLAVNPGKAPPELVLDELPAARVEFCDDRSDDDEVRVPHWACLHPVHPKPTLGFRC